MSDENRFLAIFSASGSSGGGGVNIYNADGTILTGRVATLTDTLSFNNGTLVSFNQNVDINANWRPDKGVLNINTNNQSFAGLGLTDTVNGYYGGFFWRPTTNYLTIGSNSAGIALEPTANNQAYVFKSNQFEFTKGGTIQGQTAIKGTNTLSTSSALQIYDGDSTPNLLWDFRNNGNVHLGQATTFNSTAQEIIKLNTTSGANSYATLNSNSTGQNISLRFEQGGSPKYNVGSWNSIFTIYNFTSGSQVLTIDTTDKVNLLTPSVTTKDFNIGGTVDVTNSSTNPLNVSSLASGNCFISINSNSTAFNSNIQYKQGGSSKWNAGVLADGSFSFYNHVTTNTPIKITSSDIVTIKTNLDMDNNRITKAVVNPSVQEVTSSATFTINADQQSDGVLTAMASATTIASPSGTPVQSQSLVFRFKDNGTARAITWNAIFRAIGVTLPTTTTANKLLYVGCKYNSTDTKWDVVSVQEEA